MSYNEAEILSKEVTWKIMDNMRQAGAKGITAEDIIKKENLSPSVVYAALKELYRLQYVFLYPKSKKDKRDRKKRFVCEKGTWGKYGIDKEFDATLSVEGLLDMVNEEIDEPVLRVFKTIYDEFSNNRKLHKFLPTKHTNICPNCLRSHEAMEFFYAIILRSIDLMITESEEFNKFLKARGYASDDSPVLEKTRP